MRTGATGRSAERKAGRILILVVHTAVFVNVLIHMND